MGVVRVGRRKEQERERRKERTGKKEIVSEVSSLYGNPQGSGRSEAFWGHISLF